MTTFCSSCGQNITELEEENKSFVVCDRCKTFTPKGSNSYYVRKGLKGGEEETMTEKKKVAAKKTTAKKTTEKKEVVVKEQKVQKEKVIDALTEDVQKVIDYITKDLVVVDVKEQKKILAKAYRMLDK